MTKYTPKRNSGFIRGTAFITLFLTTIFAVGFAPTLVDLGFQKGIVPVANGGTGVSTLTAHGVVVGEGTSTVAVTSAGSAGAPLVSGGASADPSFTTLTVAGGGSGAVTLAAHGVIIGEGTSAVAPTATGTSGQCFISNGSSADPTWQACPSSGGTAVWFEIPTGLINSSNLVYTLANTPSPTSSLQVFANGLQKNAGGNDYTLSTNTVTFVSGAILHTGDSLWVHYTH